MKKIYGNHLGIVINSQDPEHRGRVQVFIPHLTNTLYKNWNENLKDIKIKHIEDIPTDILERLKLVLPWAECAAPIFGGGTSVLYNPETKKSANLPYSKVLENSIAPNPSRDSVSVNQKWSGNTPLFTNNLASSGINTANTKGNPDTLGDDFIPINDGKLLPNNFGGNSEIESFLLQEIPKSGLLDLKPKDSSEFFPDNKITTEGWVNIFSKLAYKESGWNSNKTFKESFSDSSGNRVISTGLFQLSTESVRGYSKFAYDPILREKMANATTESLKDPFLNSQAALVIMRRVIERSGVIETPNNNIRYWSVLDPDNIFYSGDFIKKGVNPNFKAEPETDIVDSDKQEEQPVQILNPTVANSAPNKTISGNGAASGFFSIPLNGSKVWVFFHGGEVQRPVYFAHSPEPESWLNVLQPASPSPLEQLNKNTIRHRDAFETPAGGLVFQTSIENTGTNTPEDISYVSLQNSFGSFLKFQSSDAILRSQNNISISSESMMSLGVKGSSQTVIGQDEQKYVIGDSISLIGKQDENQRKAAEELQKISSNIQESVINKTEETKGELLTNPVLNEQYLKTNESVVGKRNALIRMATKVLPHNGFDFWKKVSVLMSFVAVPVSKVSNGKDLGATVESDTVESPEKKLQAGSEEGKKLLLENVEKIETYSQELKGGSSVTVSTGDIRIQAGLTPNTSRAYANIGKQSTPSGFQKANNDGGTLVLSAIDQGDKKSHIPPLETVGNVEIVSANKLNLVAGTPGINILTGGHTNINAGSINMVSTESDTVVSSATKTTVKGQHVNIEGGDGSGKGGVLINSKNTLVMGAFSASGDMAVKGQITSDGPASFPHLIMPSMASDTTPNSGSSSVVGQATWFPEGASALFANDRIRNATTRNLQPGWPLTLDAIITLAQEVYESTLLNFGVEPTPIGFTASFPSGIQPVFGFTHTHSLVSQTHTHEITLPKGNYYNERDSWGQARPPISHTPTVAPALGDGSSPGPKSLGGCGGSGGLLPTKYSNNIKIRNTKYGVDTNQKNYNNIVLNNNWNYNPDGSINPTPHISIKEDC